MSSIPKKEIITKYFDYISQDYPKWHDKNKYYYDNIKGLVKNHVDPSCKILEIGCGTGEILNSCNPKQGVGIDISPEMIKIAKERHPEHTFICSSIEDFQCDHTFDFIILTDVLVYVYDILEVFNAIHRISHPGTKIIVTTLNPWWEPIVFLTKKIKAHIPEGPHNFIEKAHISNIVKTMNFNVNCSGYLLLAPFNIPIISSIFNSFGVRLLGLKKLSSVQYLIIQPTPKNDITLNYGCSVIIPCYNEEGNIENGIRRMPSMGKYTEIIVVNDGSTDNTASIVNNLKNEFPNLKLIDYKDNKGKGHAVDAGFSAATQEIIMILDADLSVAPEELPRFFDPLNKGQCQFVNGSRLVYPMENKAMRSLNLIGNKVFGIIMSFITNQKLTDTLCGTKALYKKDYERINMGVDKWGDFDLLFGAAKLGNKIIEVPVHYKDRLAGESKMKTLQHGFHLLKACYRGFKDLIIK